ncbi:MAG: diaminopimelate decarboxylase [Nitrososphaerota archaeon]|nr:diaminopimelate decarboxylase [Nitrososphaerota archaeon]MDG6975725.1 diaminopimelate decarboxylase [Nitrososphaerota archaeon]
MEERRPHLRMGGGTLSVGGVSAGELAEKYGTPLYVTDLDRVQERYSSAARALASRHGRCLLAFAYKSNSTPEVVESLARLGAGATVVSVAGVELSGAVGVSHENVVFDGPSKSKAELAAAIKGKVGMINAESTQEVLDIDALCGTLGVSGCRVGFRVNFGIAAPTHPGLATGSSTHKFGVPREEVVRFCTEAAPRLKHAMVVGLHSHVGSQVADTEVFRQEAEELVRLADELRKVGTGIGEFNFGGGLGVDYTGSGGALGFEGYADATAGTFSRLGGDRDARLVFELGRSIVADSTVMLTKVNYVKMAGTTPWALVDAGMNDFIRPALYGAYHDIVPARVADSTESGASYDIGGPVCETTDVFGSGRKLGVKLAQGDLLAVLDAGAYGTSMASTYNMRPLPATVLVTKGRHRLARQFRL